MDLQKPTTVSAARFNEISKQIKSSIELVTQLRNPFTYSEPTPVDTQLTSNSSIAAISSFEFREPLQRLKSEENDPTEELAQLLSMLNIGCGDASQNQLDSCNEPIQTPDNHRDSSINEEVEKVISNVGNENIGISSTRLTGWIKEEKSDDYLISSYINDNIETSSIHFNDDSIKEEPDESVNKESSTYQTDCCKQHDVENDANDNIQRSSSEPAYSSEQDIQSDAAAELHNDMIQSSSSIVQINNCAHEDVENDERRVDDTDTSQTSNLRSNVSVEQNFQSDAVTPSDNIVETDCSHRQNAQNNVAIPIAIETFIQTDCSTEKDDQSSNHHNDSIRIDECVAPNVENNETIADNTRTSVSVQPDCPMEEHDQNIEISNDQNYSNQSTGFETDCSNKKNVENIEESTDVDDNHQPIVDIDPNTQVTHLDVDNSKNDHRPQKPHDSQPLPFLIKHIHKITWPNQEEVFFAPVVQLFGQTFSTVMVYGVVTSLQFENGGLQQRFIIDDGSGAVTVVWKADQRILDLVKSLRKLEEDIKQCRQSGLSVINENWDPSSKECTEMLNSFNQIILYIKREVTKRTKLKLFGHAAVVGQLIRPPGKGIVQLHSTMVQDDSGDDRSLELYFKKNLIRLYEGKYILPSD